MSDGPPLAVIAWPFEHGSPDIGMGAGAALLAGRRGAARDAERHRLGADRHTASGAFDTWAATAAITALPQRLYLHVDLDVLDTSVGHANRYAAPGGPSLETVLATIDATFDHATVPAAALTAYEPPADSDGRILTAARTIARRIADRALAQR